MLHVAVLAKLHSCVICLMIIVALYPVILPMFDMKNRCLPHIA